MSWSKIFTIARFELLSVISRFSFVLVTFGLPVLFGAFFGLTGLLQGQAIAKRAAAPSIFGLVDESDSLAGTGPSRIGAVSFERFGSAQAASHALEQRQVDGYFVIARDYRDTARVRLIAAEGDPFEELSSRAAERELEQWLRQRLIAQYVPSNIAELALHPMNIERVSASHPEAGARPEAPLVKLMVPFLVGFFLVTALVGTSSYLIQAVANEKESKVVEVLLASAGADEILLGKLIGLGSAGLLQFMVWAGMLVATGLSAAAYLAGLGIEIPWLALLVSSVYFVVGYFFMGSLMLATGSFGTSARESQQYAVAWSMLVVIPIALSTILMFEPHGTLARVLTWIPFTAPVTLALRLSLDPAGVAIWELGGALAVLSACTWASTKLAARLFRVGLLLTGARPSLRALFRQARLGA